MAPPSNISVLEKKIQTKLRTRMKSSEADAMKITKVIVSEEKTVEVIDFDGANNFTAVSGVAGPSATKIRAFKSSSDPARKEMWIPWDGDQDLDEEALSDIVSSMVFMRAEQDVGMSIFTFLFGARAIAHPENSVSGSPIVANGGGPLYCVDNIDVTAINSGATFARTNNSTNALTATNLLGELDKRASYRDRDGGQGTAPTDKLPYLVVVPALGSTAKSLFEQKGDVYDGTGMRPGFADKLAGVVVAPPGATSATDAWAVVYTSDVVNDAGAVVDETAPICLHMREAVKVRFDQVIPGTGAKGIYCELAYDVFPHPMIDRDLFYSEP